MTKTNLGRMDCYESEIPEEDIETALKVIRSIRNFCLGPDFFDADGAVILSHAHAKIVELTAMTEATEEIETPDSTDEIGVFDQEKEEDAEAP